MTNIIEADMAWDSITRPNEIIFKHKVPESICKLLVSVLIDSPIRKSSIKNFSLASLKPVKDIAGHYCLQIEDKKWFLRITRRKRKNPDIEDIITSYLFKSGIDVVLPILSNLYVRWEGHNYLMSVFPFVEGRHFNGTDNDLVVLSLTVSRMHKILKSLVIGDKIYLAAFDTAKRLAKTKDMIADAIKTKDFYIFYERAKWVEQNCSWLKNMVESFNPYLCAMPDSQCVHGELHLGNVIFSLDGSKAFIVDFEETPDAWFPRSFDIAYVVHRFCLDQNPSRVLLSKRLDIIKHYYGALPHDLKEMMRQVCWYNIALLVDRSARRESISPEGEYDKFVNLEKITNNML